MGPSCGHFANCVQDRHWSVPYFFLKFFIYLFFLRCWNNFCAFCFTCLFTSSKILLKKKKLIGHFRNSELIFCTLQTHLYWCIKFFMQGGIFINKTVLVQWCCYHCVTNRQLINIGSTYVTIHMNMQIITIGY